MKRHQTTKYRKQHKKEVANRKAKQEQMRIAEGLQPEPVKPDAPPMSPTIYVDEHEPEEIIDKLKETGADIKVMSPARRAFQDKGDEL